MLGAGGTGIVLLRNAVERRGELAVLRALGFTRTLVFRLLAAEHALIVGLGVVCGLVPGLAAVAPSVVAAGGEIPWMGVACVVGLTLGVGVVSVLVAASAVVRREFLSALRSE